MLPIIDLVSQDLTDQSAYQQAYDELKREYDHSFSLSSEWAQGTTPTMIVFKTEASQIEYYAKQIIYWYGQVEKNKDPHQILYEFLGRPPKPRSPQLQICQQFFEHFLDRIKNQELGNQVSEKMKTLI